MDPNEENVTLWEWRVCVLVLLDSFIRVLCVWHGGGWSVSLAQAAALQLII